MRQAGRPLQVPLMIAPMTGGTQRGRDCDFRGVARRLEQRCGALAAEGIPVFAREVCFGMTTASAARLVECGVAGIDLAKAPAPGADVGAMARPSLVKAHGGDAALRGFAAGAAGGRP